MPVSTSGGDHVGALRRVLCAVQEAEHREQLRKGLADWDTTDVPNAFEALRAAGQGAFDAYVISYWLPDLAGTSLTREIRKIDPHVPICVITQNGSRSERARVLRAGADAVLQPEPASAIAETLRTLLWHAEDRNDKARADEARAINEELRRQAAVLAERTERARRLSEQAIERMARGRALKAFVAAGGSLAEFERTWHTAFASARRR